MYYVYILQSLKDYGYYIGVTNNIDKRLDEHNRGLSKSTKPRRPFKLVYKESFSNIKQAYRREKYLKSLKKRKYIDDLVKTNNV